MIFFEEGSPNRDIHDAMREAERVRKELREEEAEKILSRATVVEQSDGDDPDGAPMISRRQIERRSYSRGRSRS